MPPIRCNAAGGTVTSVLYWVAVATAVALAFFDAATAAVGVAACKKGVGDGGASRGGDRTWMRDPLSLRTLELAGLWSDWLAICIEMAFARWTVSKATMWRGRRGAVVTPRCSPCL